MASRVERLQNRLHELELVNDLMKTLTSTLELPEVLRIVLGRIKQLTSAEALSLLLFDAARDELVFAATETLRENALLGVRVPLWQSLAGWVARHGTPLVVADVATDPRFFRQIDRDSGFQTRSLVALPLRSKGKVTGVVELANRYDGQPFGDAEAARLEALLVRVDGDAERLAADPEAMRGLLARAVAEVPSEAASLLLFDPRGKELVFHASRTLQPGVVDGLRIATDKGIAGWVARHREAVLLEDAASDPRHAGEIATRIGTPVGSMICVPMVSKGELRGVIQVLNRLGGGPFDPEEARLTQLLADHAAIAIENASLYQQAFDASLTDDLTGLGNTRHLNRVLPEMARSRPPLSLVVLDFDRFKELVDRDGHLAGSRVIGDLGRRFAKELRPGDFAARFGGDEFVFLLPETGTADAADLAERLRRVVEESSIVESVERIDVSIVTASLGVATFPDHAGDARDLFRAADAAMYEAKRRGRNRVQIAAGR